MEKRPAGRRALFIDRDGILNDLVYYSEEGRVGSPMSAAQLKVSEHAGDAVKKAQALGFKAIVISNQPGVAKRQFSYSELLKMNAKIARNLARRGVRLDAEYYCLHHPDAVVTKYRLVCNCRKPKPGLLLKAATEQSVDLTRSFFVGDSLVDVKAGKAAGCKTILVATMTDLLNRVIVEENAGPDYIMGSISKVPPLLETILKEK